MLFLSPLFLWFLAAASAPVIIHLINRRRHKTIQWAAMQFLLKASRELRGKKKLRHILILTCRTLALVTLALAAARPIASGILGWGGGAIDTVVLVLDRSASMEASTADGSPSRRASVLEEVRDAMDALGSARLVLIDSATGSPQEVATPEVLGDLSATAATDSTADLPELFNRAVEYLAESDGRSEIWIASDMQSSNWKSEDARWSAARASLAALPKPPEVRVLASSAPGLKNRALRLIACRRDGKDLVLDVEVSRSGDALGSETVPLTTHINGLATTASMVVPGQSFRFQKRIELGDGNGEGYGWLSIPSDGNPRDNVAFFAYGSERPAELLLVTGGGEAAQYLGFAAAPPGLDGYQLEQVEPTMAGPKIRDDLAAIFWTAPFPEGQTAEALKGYLERGGHVVFFAPQDSASGSFEELVWSPTENADPGKFYILKDWNRLEGPLRDGIDGTPVAGAKLKGIKRRIPDDTTTPLATWEDGQPFLSRRIIERGTAWFAGSVPDYTWSNLADADVLLPLTMRIVAAGADRLDSRRISAVGLQSAQPIGDEVRERIDTYGSPDPANTAYESGVFQIGERTMAVNRPESESDLTVIDREQLNVVLDGTGYTFLDQAGQSDASDSRDVWQAFLVAMLVFLILEAWLCLPKRQASAADPIVPSASI